MDNMCNYSLRKPAHVTLKVPMEKAIKFSLLILHILHSKRNQCFLLSFLTKSKKNYILPKTCVGRVSEILHMFNYG